MFKRSWIAALGLLISVNAANAQTPPQPGPQAILGGVVSLAVTTASASVALPVSTTAYPVVTLLNDGSSEIFVLLGGSGVVATTASVPLPPGSTIRLSVLGAFWPTSPASYVAAIAATGTSTLRVLQANGP